MHVITSTPSKTETTLQRLTKEELSLVSGGKIKADPREPPLPLPVPGGGTAGNDPLLSC